MFRKTSLVLALLAASLAACEKPRPAYAPVTTTGADFVGHADYAFPPNAPHGRVTIATFGAKKIGREPFVHLRITTTNEGQEPWTIDKTEQRLEIALGRERDRQVLVAPRTDLDDSETTVQVGSGETKPVDLFFPLPAEARNKAEAPSFTALWTVRVGDRAVAMATPFERLVTATPPPS
jgi:hypothetical protein